MNDGEELQPIMMIRFEGVGSAHFGISVPDERHQISPLQMFALAEYLRFKATSMLAEQEYLEKQRAAMNKIAVPKQKGIIDPARH